MVKGRVKHIFNIVASFLVVFLIGAGCVSDSVRAKRMMQKKVTLEFWGVFDTNYDWEPVIKEYTSTRLNVDIKYRKIKFENYEKELLEAWAEGRGPDIIMFHNTWTEAYKNKLIPAPDENIEIPVGYVSGGLKKKVSYSFEDVSFYKPLEVKDKFVKMVYENVVSDNKVWGLPLSVDSLVLYYNRSLLDQSGIVIPPQTWTEVANVTKKLTKYDNDGNIIQSAIALGGAYNINRSFDILSLLMAQNGTQFTTPDGSVATFARGSIYTVDKDFRPGQEALRFYTDFAKPEKEIYTWSEDLPQAQEMFASGRLAMMIGYSYQRPIIKSLAPKIDLGIAPVPHININKMDAPGISINWGSFWALGVSKTTENEKYAWDFVNFATTNTNVVQKYLDRTDKPGALRVVISSQISDPKMSVFANQALTATSWYRGKKITAVEKIFKDMILKVVEGKLTTKDAIVISEQLVNQTY